ncbi:MAG: FIST N-terminal domain-containing protein [Gemmataceae bacterium]
MPFASALSTEKSPLRAVAEVVAATNTLPGPPSLAVVFFSTHHLPAAANIGRQLQEKLDPDCLIGCQGEAIAGTGREVEGEPALSLWVAHWGGKVTAECFHLTPELTPDGPTLFGWPDSLVDTDFTKSLMLTLGDPYTFPATDLFLPRLNEDYAGLRVHGGMASGMSDRGQTRLLLNDSVYDDGAVGVLLRGNVGIRGVVSQGCRPVGHPYVVTKAKENIIFELGGKPPVFQLRDLLRQLPELDQQMFQQGPHIGLAMSELKDQFGRDDFLVRNLYGMDPQNGAIAITDRVRVGQTVQFLVRDAASADDDLHVLLKQDREKHTGKPAGALMFTCNGRGTRLFPHPHHDAAAIAAEFGPIPLAGFFAAGELGPVGGKNFLHGFTASVVLFEE